MKNSNFFYTSIFNSLRFSLSRLSVIVISLFIGAMVSAAFLNISFDIESKLSKELKVYGANFIISPKGEHIAQRDYEAALRKIPRETLKDSVPFLYGMFSLGSNSAIVAGVDLGSFKSAFPFIEVREGHFGESVFGKNSAFVGVSLAKILEIKVGDTISVTNAQNLASENLIVQGIISSGDEIDGILIAPLKIVQNLVLGDFVRDSANLADSTNITESGARDSAMDSAESTQDSTNATDFVESAQDSAQEPYIHYAELVLYGDFDSVNALGEALSSDTITAKPIAQVSLSEGVVLDKIKSLMLLICLVVLVITSLSVNTSLSSIIYARKKEVALHLSLGASKKQIIKLFGSEVFIVALISSVLGAFGGYALANLLGAVIFNASISFRFASIVLAVLITLGFVFLASFYPIKKALEINIITNLKGE